MEEGEKIPIEGCDDSRDYMSPYPQNISEQKIGGVAQTKGCHKKTVLFLCF